MRMTCSIESSRPTKNPLERVGTEGAWFTVTNTQLSLTNTEFENLFHEVSNWDRWGAQSDRGTLNYLTPDRVVVAA